MATEDDADAIRDVFERDGELSARIEVRRRFPRVTSGEEVRDIARVFAGRTFLPRPEARVTRLVTRKWPAAPTDDQTMEVVPFDRPQRQV
jgi:hypothetical protein